MFAATDRLKRSFLSDAAGTEARFLWSFVAAMEGPHFKELPQSFGRTIPFCAWYLPLRSA